MGIKKAARARPRAQAQGPVSFDAAGNVGGVMASIPPGLLAIAGGRDALPTDEAARVLSRTAKTLRSWASQGSGPIQPLRINGRLAWRVADLAKLLNGDQ